MYIFIYLFYCLNQREAFPDITGDARVCACRKKNQEPNTLSCKAALAGRGFSMLTTSRERLRSPSIHFPHRKPILFTRDDIFYLPWLTIIEWKEATRKTKQPKHLPDSAAAKHGLNPAEFADHKIALSARLNTCLGPENAGWQDWIKGQTGIRAAGAQSLRLDNEFYQSVDLVRAEHRLNVCTWSVVVRPGVWWSAHLRWPTLRKRCHRHQWRKPFMFEWVISGLNNELRL